MLIALIVKFFTQANIAGSLCSTCQILKKLRELDCKSVTIGSDAHTAEDLGKGIKEASILAKNLGFNVVRFEKRVVIK